MELFSPDGENLKNQEAQKHRNTPDNQRANEAKVKIVRNNANDNSNLNRNHQCSRTELFLFHPLLR